MSDPFAHPAAPARWTELNVGLVGDRELAGDLDALATAMVDELTLLVKSTTTGWGGQMRLEMR